MSFNVDMGSILQYAYNFFASALPLVWPFVGVTLAVVTIAGLMYVFAKRG
ncbi:hypothetical protein REC12_15485 [Desulfosporosinus sp. PR]|nr:hypothetical protein [Desulfosporosinus sp. PR]MDQ7094998.1 hypothetical protein [Desulfosporosinus sp. PR]